MKDLFRFISRCIDLKPCWEWKTYLDQDGYANLRSKKKIVKAHRFSYENFIGKIPKNREIDHLCKNTKCVNPLHLEPVTRKVNLSRVIRVLKTECKRGHKFTPLNTYRWDNSKGWSSKRM